MCYELKSANDFEQFEGMGNLEMTLNDGYKKWLEQNEINKHIEDIKPEWSNATNYVLIDENGHILGLDKVLVTCRENNIGSKKTIEKCSGISDTPVPSRIPGIMELRYWIYLDENNSE